MENFNIGDIVICINDGNMDNRLGTLPPLKKGREYIVGDIRKCKCGKINLDVGISDTHGPTCNCGYKLSGNVWWCYAARFIKKPPEKKETEIELSETTIEDLIGFHSIEKNVS